MNASIFKRSHLQRTWWLIPQNRVREREELIKARTTFINQEEEEKERENFKINDTVTKGNNNPAS